MLRPKFTHSWSLTEEEAVSLQSVLARQVIKDDLLNAQVNLVGGVDVAYDKNSDCLFAVAIILEAATLKVIETSSVEDTVKFPYIPGLFSFRELPSLSKALEQLSHIPDLIICDGHGIAHPRRFGLACHLGILYDIPTIGCSKNQLIGDSKTPNIERGEFTPIIDKSEVIGRTLRTQSNIKPVYISVGHRISIETACDWILKLSPQYRLPETTRLSDQYVRSLLQRKSLKS